MSESPAEARRRRRLARADWPGRIVTLDEPEPLLEGDPGRLIAMVYPLTMSCWAIMGRPIPDYTRADMPGRVIRPGD